MLYMESVAEQIDDFAAVIVHENVAYGYNMYDVMML